MENGWNENALAMGSQILTNKDDMCYDDMDLTVHFSADDILNMITATKTEV